MKNCCPTLLPSKKAKSYVKNQKKMCRVCVWRLPPMLNRYNNKKRIAAAPPLRLLFNLGDNLKQSTSLFARLRMRMRYGGRRSVDVFRLAPALCVPMSCSSQRTSRLQWPNFGVCTLYRSDVGKICKKVSRFFISLESSTNARKEKETSELRVLLY